MANPANRSIWGNRIRYTCTIATITLLAAIVLFALPLTPAHSQDNPTSTPESVPITAEDFVALGNRFLSEGKLVNAFDDFNHAIALDPRYSDGYDGRGRAYLRAGRPQQAINDFNRAIALDPRSKQAYKDRGDAFFRQRKYAQAVNDYSQAIALDPEYADAYVNRGLVYARQDRYDDAIADISQGITIDPHNIGYYFERGNLYYQHGAVDLALADYTLGIEASPKTAGAYLYRGYTYSQQGDISAAAADYLQWLKLISKQVDEIDLVTHDQQPFTTTVDMTLGLVTHIPFEARSGQVMTFSASSVTPHQVDPLLILLDPHGTPIYSSDDISADNADALMQNVALTADGTYTLIIGHAGGGNTGKVAVKLEVSASAPEATPEAAAGS